MSTFDPITINVTFSFPDLVSGMEISQTLRVKIRLKIKFQ